MIELNYYPEFKIENFSTVPVRICAVVDCNRKAYGYSFTTGMGTVEYSSLELVPSIVVCDEHLMLLREEAKQRR